MISVGRPLGRPAGNGWSTMSVERPVDNGWLTMSVERSVDADGSISVICMTGMYEPAEEEEPSEVSCAGFFVREALGRLPRFVVFETYSHSFSYKRQFEHCGRPLSQRILRLLQKSQAVVTFVFGTVLEGSLEASCIIEGSLLIVDEIVDVDVRDFWDFWDFAWLLPGRGLMPTIYRSGARGGTRLRD